MMPNFRSVISFVNYIEEKRMLENFDLTNIKAQIKSLDKSVDKLQNTESLDEASELLECIQDNLDQLKRLRSLARILLKAAKKVEDAKQLTKSYEVGFALTKWPCGGKEWQKVGKEIERIIKC